MEEHFRSGGRWTPPAFHSGYNEIIVNSKHHNANLPQSVEAFFVPKGAEPRGRAQFGYDVEKAHQSFLSEYGLTPADVPLLEFDPEDWERPFSPYPIVHARPAHG